VIGPRALV